MNKNNPVLLVEDDQVDQKTTQRSFKTLNIPNPLKIVENGSEAVKFLKNPANPTPFFILLDLHMPTMSGSEFLQIIKKHDALKQVPVVVLTISDEEGDMMESYNLSVAGYMKKPVDPQTFVEAIKTINQYWAQCRLPPSIHKSEM